MRFTHAVNGSTEGSILVSHIYLDVCSSLTLIYERHANMDDLVKLRKNVSEVISCSDDIPVFKKKLQTFIHAFSTWCVFQRHKIQMSTKPYFSTD